jgi:hypothetical protein
MWMYGDEGVWEMDMDVMRKDGEEEVLREEW